MKVKGENVVDGKVELDYGVAKSAAAGVNLYDITTNADRVVVDDGTNAVAGATKANADISGKAADGITYTITMTKGDVTRTETVKVTIKEARTDTSITGVTIKGVEAELVSGKTDEYTVTIPTANNDAVTPQLVVGTQSGNLVSAIADGTTAITDLNKDVSKMDAADGKKALGKSGDFTFTITAESGATKLYKVAVTLKTAATLTKVEKQDAPAAPAGTAIAGTLAANNIVLTIPAGAEIKAVADVATYLKFTADTNAKATVTDVTGDKITVVASNDGGTFTEDTTYTITWKTETVTLSPEFTPNTTAGSKVTANVKGIIIDVNTAGTVDLTSVVDFDASGAATAPTVTCTYTFKDDNSDASNITYKDENRIVVVTAVAKTAAGVTVATESIELPITVETIA